MLQVSHYDPAERQREKDRARERDDRALRQGDISREALRIRNSFLAPLDVKSSFVRHRSIVA